MCMMQPWPSAVLMTSGDTNSSVYIFFTKTTLSHSTRLLAATTLRNVLGTKLLSEILSEREGISKLIKVSNSNYLIIISRSQETLDEATDPWGVRVQMVELKVYH